MTHTLSTGRFTSALFAAIFMPLASLALLGCEANLPLDPKEVSAMPSTQPAGGVAVVELFTSEGCSSCPSADAALADLVRDRADTPVYALAFHVDYWDNLGWPDRFASPAFTERQRSYAQQLRLDNVYTPQVIVNGVAEFVGSNRARLGSAVDASLATPASAVLSATATQAQGRLSVDVSSSGLPPGALVHVAVVQREASSKVQRGENRGRELKHANVVRAFASADLTESRHAIATLTLPADLTAADVTVVAYATDGIGPRVIAATSTQVQVN